MSLKGIKRLGIIVSVVLSLLTLGYWLYGGATALDARYEKFVVAEQTRQDTTEGFRKVNEIIQRKELYDLRRDLRALKAKASPTQVERERILELEDQIKDLEESLKAKK